MPKGQSIFPVPKFRLEYGTNLYETCLVGACLHSSPEPCRLRKTALKSVDWEVQRWKIAG
jgi:hypothetical protein